MKNIVTTKTQLTTQLTHINQRWVGVGSLGQRPNAKGSDVQAGVLIWRGRDGSIIDVDPSEYYTWGFCNLVVNSGMRIWPIRGLRARQ